MTATVIIITGHPAMGKTTLAKALAEALHIPYFHRDGSKEVMFDRLGKKDVAWSKELGRASFDLLFYQCEMLLKADVSHIIEANFSPQYANESWQTLQSTYQFQAIQILCKTTADIAVKRHEQRIADGSRHHGHIFDNELSGLVKRVSNPIGWLDVEGQHIELDTTPPLDEYLPPLVDRIQPFIR